MDQRCQYCGTEPETANHVLFTCHVARQTWARSLFPLPENGFSEDSVFTNLHYLFQMSKNIKIPLEIRRVFPWVLWSLWKNRNKLFFEGKEIDGEASIQKIQQEAEVWFLTQSLDHQEEKKKEREEGMTTRKWRTPPTGWLKCNVGWYWIKKTRSLGCAWIVRDSKGMPVWHSRRSFVGVQNLKDAKMQACHGRLIAW